MSVDCDSSANEPEMAQSSAAVVESSMSASVTQVITSPPRTKTKSKSCGNSPKCCSREHSRPHSPAWKKPSKSGSPVAELEREGGEEAPFGRESGAASAYSSPYSERATPPYMRWAKSLEDVLDDYEGMELFKQFLVEQGEGHLLDFWYACKGFKMQDVKECDRIRKVAERLHTDYVTTRGVHYLPFLSQTTRATIHGRLFSAQTNIDQTVFDDAHKEVQTYLRDRHAQFVTSDPYILYLQDIQVGGWDSPKCFSHEVHSNNSSSSGEARRPSSTLLPTVHEDTEFESESERLAASASLDQAATASAVPKEFGPAEAENSWPNQPSNASKPYGQQQNATSGMIAASGMAPSGGDSVSGALSATGVKRRAGSVVSTSSGQQMRSGGSLLTRDTLVATANYRQRTLATKPITRCGGVPHPYHTPYVPYLPTSAQDSELQSMSSDATTESGFSGANYQRKEYRIMQHHVEHNRDPSCHQNLIPRTERSRPDLQTRDMTNEAFCHTVKEKLERLRREQERDEKLEESLTRLSEPENNQNDHRAAVNKFYNEERNRRQNEPNAEDILEDYCSRVPYFKDSPKQSPLRSPGMPVVGRRRSPIAKSPIRAMTTSYPSAGQPQIAAFSHPNAKVMIDPAMLSQSVIQQSRSKSGHHSAGNTIHRAPKHEQFVPATMAPVPIVDKRTSGTVTRKPMPRYPVPASDTSGIYSGTSTEPSLVSARFTPNMGPRGNEQHWHVDRHGFENVDNEGVRHKLRSGSSNNAAAVQGAGSESKSHRTSGHRSGDKSTSSEKTRTQKVVTENQAAQMHKSMPVYPRRSEPAGLPAPSLNSDACNPVQEIIVGIFLPNEKTPYLVRFPGHQITLKQFKPLIPRKGSFRYFFQCVSNELGTGTVQREVFDDHEILPFCDNNKIVAKIVVSE